MELVGFAWSINSYGSYICTKDLREDIKMKKYSIWAHKLYGAKDVEGRIGIKESEIKSFLEKRKNIGRKMGNFWFIRGSEILEINRLLKEKR